MRTKRSLFSFFCILSFCFSFLSLEAAVPEGAKYKRKRVVTDFYLSPRALSRGNTYITTASGQDSLFLNPALLPIPKGAYDRTYILDPTFVGSERTLKTIKEFQDISTILDPQGLSEIDEFIDTYENLLDVFEDWETEATSLFTSFFIGSFFKYVGFGFLSSASLDLDSGLTTVDTGVGNESVRINSLITVGPSLAFAYPFLNETLKVGLAVRYLVRFEINADQGLNLYDLQKLRHEAERDGLETKDFTAFDHKPAFDLGVVYQPNIFLNPRFGIVFANMGNVNFQDQDGRVKYQMEPIRQNLGLGMSIHPELGPGVLSVSLDIRDITGSYDTSFLTETYLGIDYFMFDTIGVSTGLSQGYPSIGFYLTTRVVQIDIGFNTRERELRAGVKPDPRFFFKLTLSI